MSKPGGPERQQLHGEHDKSRMERQSPKRRRYIWVDPAFEGDLKNRGQCRCRSIQGSRRNAPDLDYSEYALRQNMGLRFTYMFDRYETDDWTWANWNYSPAEGGTTVRQDPLQKVHFFGVTGYYRWW